MKITDFSSCPTCKGSFSFNKPVKNQCPFCKHEIMNKNQTTNIKATLDSLKKNNKRVTVEHFRMSIKNNCLLPLKFFKITKSQDDMAAKQGLTIISIKDNDGDMHIGVSRCHVNDNFNRARGVLLALNRLKKVD